MKELVVYGRRFGCSDQIKALSFLQENQVTYRFVDIGADREAALRLQEWVGHQSVPTLFVAQPGHDLPVADPAPLDRSRRIRGQNRGTLITEPNDGQLADFLRQHDLL